jgi:hypothetical protein
MTIRYILTPREIAFLKALKTDTFRPYQWSGRGQDDKFRNEWKEEIETFRATDLIEKKDGGGDDEYWTYGLTDEAFILVSEYIVVREKVKLKQLEDAITNINTQKTIFIKAQDYANAALLRDHEKTLLNLLNQLNKDGK